MLIPYPLTSIFRPAVLGAAALLLGLAAGCSYSHGDPAPVSECDTANQTITYSGVVSPILDANCRRCHGTTTAATRGGSINLGDYQTVNRFSSNILLGSIQHEQGYSPMPRGAAKLSTCDIERIQRWIDAGKPNN